MTLFVRLTESLYFADVRKGLSGSFTLWMLAKTKYKYSQFSDKVNWRNLVDYNRYD